MLAIRPSTGFTPARSTATPVTSATLSGDGTGSSSSPTNTFGSPTLTTSSGSTFSGSPAGSGQTANPAFGTAGPSNTFGSTASSGGNPYGNETPGPNTTQVPNAVPGSRPIINRVGQISAMGGGLGNPGTPGQGATSNMGFNGGGNPSAPVITPNQGAGTPGTPGTPGTIGTANSPFWTQAADGSWTPGNAGAVSATQNGGAPSSNTSNLLGGGNAIAPGTGSSGSSIDPNSMSNFMSFMNAYGGLGSGAGNPTGINSAGPLGSSNAQLGLLYQLLSGMGGNSNQSLYSRYQQYPVQP